MVTGAKTVDCSDPWHNKTEAARGELWSGRIRTDARRSVRDRKRCVTNRSARSPVSRALGANDRTITNRLAQSRDDLIRSSLARFHCAFQVTLSVDGSVFAAEMDVALRLSFDAGKTGVLPDLPVAVAAETVRITLPPIDCGTTVPV